MKLQMNFDPPSDHDLVSDDPMEVNEYMKQNNLYTDPKHVGARCKDVHDGGTPVVFWNLKCVSGAEGAEVDPTYADLIIDLAGVYSQSAIKDNDFVKAGLNAEDQGHLWERLNKHVAAPPVIRIKWKDMSVPPVGAEFWVDVWDLLPEGHTIICCHGGHGRTGTALAALLVTRPYQPCSAEEAIKEVREYCPCAIETEEQENYIYELAQVC